MVVRNVGDVDKGFAAAAKTLEADYYVPHLSHAPMEPEVAVADFRDGKCTLWAPTQNPQAVQDTVATAVGIVNVASRKHVVVNSLKRGDPAPDFSLPGSDGRTYRLKELLGRPVVIAWFPKAFTGG